MSKKDRKRSAEPDLASFEVNILETLLNFHKRTMALLRESSLSDEKLEVVSERLKSMLDDVKAKIGRSEDLDVAAPLDAVYEEVKRMVEELAGGGDK